MFIICKICRKNIFIILTLLIIFFITTPGYAKDSENIKKLISDVKKEIESFPVEEKEHFLQAASYYEKGMIDLKKGIEKHDSSLLKQGTEELGKSIKICPYFTPAQFGLTFLWIAIGETELKSPIKGGEEKYQLLIGEMMDKLEMIIELNPDEVSVATCYILRSQYYFRQKEYEKALEEIQLAIKTDSHYLGAYQVLAQIYQALGNEDKARIASLRKSAEEAYKKEKYEEAISRFKKIMELDSQDATLHSSLAMAYHKTGKDTDAKKEFYKAISLDPNFSEPYTKLAYILNKEGKTDEAIAELRKAIKIDPYNFEARVKLVSLLNNSKKFQEVLIEFQEAVRLRPPVANSPVLLSMVANAFNHFEDYDGTISVSNKILKLAALQPRLKEKDKKFLGDIYLMSASAYDKKQAYEKAIEALEEAIKLRPDWSEPWICLGATYQKIKDNEKALVAYKKAVVLSPKGKHADDLRKIIKGIESRK